MLLSLFVFFVLIGSFSILSLGSEEHVDNQSTPLQQTEHNQQGKQFDHVNPSIFKSNILFATCMYALLFCVKLCFD